MRTGNRDMAIHLVAHILNRLDAGSNRSLTGADIAAHQSGNVTIVNIFITNQFNVGSFCT